MWKLLSVLLLIVLFTTCRQNEDVSAPFGCSCNFFQVEGNLPAPKSYLWHPNLVTPNGDGINDYLFFMLRDSANHDVFDDYNGWKLEVRTIGGQMIYSTENYKRDYSFNDWTDAEYLYNISLTGYFKLQGKVLVNRNGKKVQNVYCCRVENSSDPTYEKILREN